VTAGDYLVKAAVRTRTLKVPKTALLLGPFIATGDFSPRNASKTRPPVTGCDLVAAALKANPAPKSRRTLRRRFVAYP
jgi:hypothetical protein